MHLFSYKLLMLTNLLKILIKHHTQTRAGEGGQAFVFLRTFRTNKSALHDAATASQLYLHLRVNVISTNLVSKPTYPKKQAFSSPEMLLFLLSCLLCQNNFQSRSFLFRNRFLFHQKLHWLLLYIWLLPKALCC